MKAFLLLATATALLAQPLKLSQALEQAMTQYPSLRINEEQIKAAASGIQLARTAYLPKVDTVAQVNRATRNNIYGMLLQQQVISPISGPPLIANAGTNVFGSAVGFLVQWEPFDFGLRKAQVGVAESEKRVAEASLRKTRFEVSTLTADAYLNVLAAAQAVRIAEANLQRLVAIEGVVNPLVTAGLRPGLDASRTAAEKAALDAQLVQTQQALAVAKANLGQFVPGAQDVDPLRFLNTPLPPPASSTSTANHPAAAAIKSSLEVIEARQRALLRTYFPKFNVQGTTYARGSGANPDFTTNGGASGLGPNIYNWGLGFTMTFSLMDLPGLRIKREIESARSRAEQARLEALARELDTQRARALAQFEGAVQLALKTPEQVKASRTALDQVTARYKAGLIDILPVADAQRALAAAEVDDVLARLQMWRAKLSLAVAAGDLAPFVAEAEGN
ncbi:MAG: TolC family protein [Bryobacter sp.]|nr:TolC family protein [Bryobacter sp.]